MGSRRSSTASGGLGSGGVLRQVLLFAGQSRSGGQDQSGGEPGSDSDEKIENRRGSGLMATAKASRGVTVGQLKEKVGEQGPGAADLREQAKQILALKKIKWDLLVVSGKGGRAWARLRALSCPSNHSSLLSTAVHGVCCHTRFDVHVHRDMVGDRRLEHSRPLVEVSSSAVAKKESHGTQS